MSVSKCAINGLYNMICRDPDTAEGGLDPSETEKHGDGFYRVDRVNLDDIPDMGLDRKVQIVYNGTVSYGTVTNGLGAKRQRTYAVILRIGYACGDNPFDSFQIIDDDEMLVAKRIHQSAYWPDCQSGCVQGYVPVSSSIYEIGDGKYILEILIEITVYG